MFRFLLLSLLSVAVWGCGSSVDESGSQAQAPPSELSAERFTRVLEDGYRERGLPGLAAGLWVPGHTPTLLVLGEADLESGRNLGADDRFRIGSVTKSFVVTLLLQLVEEGKLSLEEPISRYLPDLQNGEATLRQLAGMTSGIFNYTEDRAYVLELLEDIEAPREELELLEVANRNAPYFPPGTDWHYSNTNTVALGMVIEQVTGAPLADELRSRIFEPLGLSASSYPTGVEMPAPFARGYVLFDQSEPPVDLTRSHPSGSAGSGAMVSNLEDLAHWGRALGEGTLLKASSQQDRLQLASTDGCENCPDYDGYGLGIGTLDGWRGHTGDYIGYQALVMYDPQTRAVAVILVNFKDLTQPGHIPTQLFRDFATRD